MDLSIYLSKIKKIDSNAINEAMKRQDILTKPKGSLGRLEELSIKVSGITGDYKKPLLSRGMFLFAGDHLTVHSEGISSAPIDVTAQMVENFTQGGASVNVLCNRINARLQVIDMGVVKPYNHKSKVIDCFIKSGADNIKLGPAMSRVEALKSIESGIKCVLDFNEKFSLDIMAIGEMGIGNTTPASAIFSVLGKIPVEDITGPGAGLTQDKVNKKAEVIKKAIELNKPNFNDPIDVLSKVGGLEIGGMAGAIIGGAICGVPVLIDGFISTAAALIAIKIKPEVEDFIILSHISAEKGYCSILNEFKELPLIDLGLRLGEGSGALIAMELVLTSMDLINNISTFSAANVIDVKEYE